jgi:hypothetical protein
MRYLILLLFFPLFLISCKGDQRQKVFEMSFPNITFILPAGLSGILPRVFELDNIPSNIAFYLKNAATDTTTITGILPTAATIYSLDSSTDFNFVREVSVRVCRQGSAVCTPADEVFYAENILNRSGGRIRLIPTEGNARRTLAKERFKLEILFYIGNVSTFNVNSRMEMTFNAVR